MKTIPVKNGQSCAPRHLPALNSQLSTLNRFRAFTLVELLTVIAIIGILAALLLPVLAGAKKAAKKRQAQVEISQIVGAIQQYDSVYGRFPVSADAQATQGVSPVPYEDVTYGCQITNNGSAWPPGIPTTVPRPYFITNNAEVIAILMDRTNYFNGSAWTDSSNTNHQKNPQQTIFLSAKMSGDAPGILPYQPGVGPDLVYRDPWGNPYFITMDLNYDEQCKDALYSLESVSQNPPLPGAYTQAGFNGLFNPHPPAPVPTAVQKDDYLYHGKVMVWSAGPDRLMDPTTPANLAPNKDNILSWQQ